MSNHLFHIFLKSIATILSGRNKRSKLLILSYHRVLEQNDELFPDIVDVNAFDNHLNILKKYFNVLKLSEAIELMSSGSLPQRSVSITFDDGYMDNIDIALPLLMKWRLPATFFISTGFLETKVMWNDIVIESIRNAREKILDLTDLHMPVFNIETVTYKQKALHFILQKIKYKNPSERLRAAKKIALKLNYVERKQLMMNASGVKLLVDSGMEVGAHTVNHPILNSIGNNDSRAEIESGKCMLESIINKKVTIFAYPNGKPNSDYNRDHINILKECNFRAAVSTAWGYADVSNDLYQLPRIGETEHNKVKFHIRLAKSYLDKQKDNV